MNNDQEYIVSGSDDKTIRIWYIQKRQVEAVLKGHSDWVTGIVIASTTSILLLVLMISILEYEPSRNK